MPEQEKLIFHPISLDDRDWINEKLREDNLNLVNIRLLIILSGQTYIVCRLAVLMGAGWSDTEDKRIISTLFRLGMEIKRR